MKWKCGECGAWVDAGYSIHQHNKVRNPTLDEMLAQRRAAETLVGTPEFVDYVSGESTTYFRTGKEETVE